MTHANAPEPADDHTAGPDADDAVLDAQGAEAQPAAGGPAPKPSLAASFVTALGIALAIASFVWIDGEGARFAASAGGLALVLIGTFMRRRAQK